MSKGRIGKQYGKNRGFYFHAKGQKFPVPFSKKFNGERYKEVTISLTKSLGQKRVENYRSGSITGQPMKARMVTIRSGGKAIYVTYLGGKRRK